MGKYISDFFNGNLFKGDKTVWMIYFLLCMVSLVEVYSASSQLTFSGGNHWSPMIGQAGFLLAGFVVIMVVHRIPCKWFMLFPFVLLPVAIGLLLYTAVLGGGSELNETHRWVSIGSISFQPSEFAKMALIMTTAVVLAKTQAEREEMVNGKKRKMVGAIKGKRHLAFTVIGICTLIICGLIFMDNVSTAMMLFLVIVVMMFIGHVPNDLMFKGLGALALLGALLVAIAVIVPNETLRKNSALKRLATVKPRIERMFDGGSRSDTTDDTMAEAHELFNDKNSQTTYAKIAVASSNFIGRGPGNSVQRDFLQHAESDFIFAIIIEELGVLGAGIVAFLYLTLLIRVGRIAQKCKTFFPAFLVLGFGIMMTLQAFVNMCVAVGLAPVTGQTLPLISKGGTSILITSFYIAVILSVSRYAEKCKAMSVTPVAVQDNMETNEYATDGSMS